MKIQDIELKWLGHSGFLIVNSEGKRVYIDPYHISENNEKADIILITHSHQDHCSIKDIQKIVKEGTIVLGPADIQSKITKLDNHIELRVVVPGQTIDLGFVKLGIVPAYNLNKQFHEKEEHWVGYIIKINGSLIYHAGDTDLIPEMKNMKNISIALLPVGGHFTMDWKEAVQAASLIYPTLAIPMHYGSDVVGTTEDAENFVRGCKEKGIKAERLEKE